MELVVGIGDFAVSDRQTDSIKTFALASCVGVTIYSSSKKAAGMIHIALPIPANSDEAKSRPFFFATTGLPLLIEKMCTEYGCLKRELKISLYGGADSVNDKDMFQIGKRNIAAVINTLEELNLQPHVTDVGGTFSRTLKLEVGTGRVTVLKHPIKI